MSNYWKNIPVYDQALQGISKKLHSINKSVPLFEAGNVLKGSGNNSYRDTFEMVRARIADRLSPGGSARDFSAGLDFKTMKHSLGKLIQLKNEKIVPAIKDNIVAWGGDGDRISAQHRTMSNILAEHYLKGTRAHILPDLKAALSTSNFKRQMINFEKSPISYDPGGMYGKSQIAEETKKIIEKLPKKLTEFTVDQKGKPVIKAIDSLGVHTHNVSPFSGERIPLKRIFNKKIPTTPREYAEFLKENKITREQIKNHAPLDMQNRTFYGRRGYLTNIFGDRLDIPKPRVSSMAASAPESFDLASGLGYGGLAAGGLIGAGYGVKKLLQNRAKKKALELYNNKPFYQKIFNKA